MEHYEMEISDLLMKLAICICLLYFWFYKHTTQKDPYTFVFARLAYYGEGFLFLAENMDYGSNKGRLSMFRVFLSDA